MPETAKRTARVPILGEDGRISDDYIPAAIGEGVESAEAAAKRAETAATAAEGSATAAGQSAAGAQGSATAASTSAAQAQQSATAASGAVTQAQSAQQAAEAAKTAAETAQSAAAGSAQDAQQSATAAAQSAASVADKFISSAQATTLEPGSQATASVADQVLTIGVPKGEKGDKGDQGEKGDTGATGATGEAATIAVGSVSTLPAGSDATVKNVGTVNAAVLAFGIPRGDVGEQGPKGDTGTGVPEGGTPGQLLSKTDSGTAWVDPPSGNVLTGEAEGFVAHAEDAYAAKPREVRVKGKTWVNRWPAINKTSNGITVSTDETGLVTVSGELELSSEGAYNFAEVSGIQENKSITVLCSRGLPDGVYLYATFFDAENGFVGTELQIGFNSTSETSKTVTVPSGTVRIVAGVAVKPNTVLSGSLSFRVMLVDGTEAPDCFTPCASITSVETGKLVTSGKNLVNTSGASVLAGTFGVRLPNVTLQPGTYVVKLPSGITGNFAIYLEGDTSTIVSAISEAGASFTLTSPIHGLDFRSSDAGQITLDNISQFQLELGSTATAYEPPTITETPLPEVELRSLPNGTCDELVIKADGTCEVERRTAKIVLNGSEEQTTPGPSPSVYGGFYFNIIFDMPDNADGVMFSPTSQVADKLRIGNGDAYQNAVGVFMNASNNKPNARISVDGIETTEELRTYLHANPITLVYTIKDDSTEPQSPVTLPALHAPTFNQYHDSPVPSDTSTEYVRDINIAFDNLAKQVAGTASAVAVREASTIEEE